jgi:glycine/D-amino acid oxidase-like deaminating enzyme
VGLTRRLTPCVGRLEGDPSVWFGLGYHGNGVNTAPWVGRAIARGLAGRDADLAEVPGMMRGLSRRFPFPSMRVWGLRGAYLYYRLKDDWPRFSR